jgi:integrase
MQVAGGKTTGSRRAVPLRARVVDALESIGHRRGLLFPAPAGGHIDINNWRGRRWTPALDAAGVQHRRICYLRHTYATWSLAAGIDIFTLARGLGTSVKLIDCTYGHLVAGADEYERELLDRFDNGRSEPDARYLGGEEDADAA